MTGRVCSVSFIVVFVAVCLAAQSGYAAEAHGSLVDRLGSVNEGTQRKAVNEAIEQRKAIITKLCQVISKQGKGDKGRRMRARATYLVGKMRAPEAVKTLISVITEDFVGRVKRVSVGVANPTQALMQIGRPAVPALLDTCRSADHERIVRPCLLVLWNTLGWKENLLVVLERAEKAAATKKEKARLRKALQIARKWEESVPAPF